MYAHVLGMCVRVSSHAPHNTTYVILFFHSQGSLSNKAEKKRKEGTASRRKVRDRLTKLNLVNGVIVLLSFVLLDTIILLLHNG